MKLPNADHAIIDEVKIREYLLSPTHPVGRFKATFFASLGYTQSAWQQLESDLRSQHLSLDCRLGEQNQWGQKYEIHGPLRGPEGKMASVVSVWIVLNDEENPRFVTAYPGVQA